MCRKKKLSNDVGKWISKLMPPRMCMYLQQHAPLFQLMLDIKFIYCWYNNSPCLLLSGKSIDRDGEIFLILKYKKPLMKILVLLPSKKTLVL